MRVRGRIDAFITDEWSLKSSTIFSAAIRGGGCPGPLEPRARSLPLVVAMRQAVARMSRGKLTTLVPDATSS